MIRLVIYIQQLIRSARAGYGQNALLTGCDLYKLFCFPSQRETVTHILQIITIILSTGTGLP